MKKLAVLFVCAAMVASCDGFKGGSKMCIRDRSYNDLRRMTAPTESFIQLQNTKPFPLRCPYGNSDTTTNAEVKAAYGNGQYVYNEKVWWAGGNRCV